MKQLGKIITAFLLVLAISGISYAGTAEMTARVRSAIDRTLAILNDPALTGKSYIGERSGRVRSIINEVMDFDEMTKRSLGIHWRKRTAGERSEFVRLFSGLLEYSYIDKIEDNYDAEVRYTGEKINKKGTRGLVRTKVLTRKDREVSIDYRMMKKERGWVAYDIVIEGVSLVSNYRTQFNQIIQKSSYEDLVKGLREKQKSRKALVLKDHQE